MDPYVLLELPYNATIDDIKKAYRRLAKQWHPDKNGGSLDAAEKFKMIKAAYDCLVDPAERAKEDRKRQEREQAEAAKNAEAERARARAHAYQPTSSGLGFNPWFAMAALLALVVVIVALLGTDNVGSNSTTA